ncbi:MAG: sulfite exporter TauE/SafE family protein [Gammaproteobacteria bacterium]
MFFPDHAFIILLASALSVGFIHTLLGPDHYLPFIVMAKARRWSMQKTTWITLLCGIGHVLSAAILGLIVAAIGITVAKLQFIESFRNVISAWLLIGFGFGYLLWGIHYALKKKTHTHAHIHSDGSLHQHLHNHNEEHAHLHTKKSYRELTPWILFIIFILGPCEPLIPLIIYPALHGSLMEVFWISLAFGAATLMVMLSLVLASAFGMQKFELHFFSRYGNALAGGVICLSGVAIRFLGL